MINLPDVSTWVALLAQRHIHHTVVRSWFLSSADHGEDFAFCRVTQMGLLRLLTNRHVMDVDVLDPASAWNLWDRLSREWGIPLLGEPVGMESDWRRYTDRPSGSRFWTDAYLAAFAHAGGYRFVTLDRGFERYADLHMLVLP